MAQLALVRAASMQISLVALAHIFAEIICYQIAGAAWLGLLVQISSLTWKCRGGGELEGNPHFPEFSNFLTEAAGFHKTETSDQESEGCPWNFR